MSIRRNFLVIFLGIFLLYGIMAYSIQRLVILPTFLQLEYNDAVENLEKVINAITKEINYLNIFCLKWSTKNNTYDFVISRSQEYIKNKLTLATFFDNNINLLYIYDINGKVILGEVYDLETKKMLQLTDFPKTGLPKTHPLLTYRSERTSLAKLSVNGIFMTEEGAMLISSRPILNGNNTGPMQGYLIVGRFVTQDFINRLFEQTQLDFQFFITQTNSLSKNIKNIVRKLSSEFPYHIEKIDRNNLLISTIFLDINDNVVFLIRVKTPRKIVKHGFIIMRHIFFIILLTGFITLIIITFFLQRTVSRQTLLVKENIYFSHCLSERQSEIDVLAKEFDGMFDKMLTQIEGQTIELEGVNEELGGQTIELGRVKDELRKDILKREKAEKALQKANNKLELLARIDGLTQIANRRKFDEYLAQQWKQSKRDNKLISLVMCDVDCFKLFNDNYGHQLGDDCLRTVAKAINKHTKRPLDLAARYGGEEFVVVLPDTNSDGAVFIAETIRKEVQQLKIVHAFSLVEQGIVTLSLGVSSLKPNVGSIKLFINLADKALYEAKEQGRNCVVLKTAEHT